MNDGLSMADFVVLVLILLCVFSTASTVLDIYDLLVEAHEVRNAAPIVEVREPTLPEICAPLYNKGNEEWITCMGVGYVKGN